MSTEPSQQPIWSHFQNHASEYGFHGSHPRHAAILRKLMRLAKVQSAVLLNIGIGDGNLERTAREKGFTCCSLDPDPEAICKLRDDGIDAKVGFIEAIPFPDEHFDFVIASEVLEHLTPEQRAAGLREVRRSLKPGGYFVGTVPYQEELNLSVTVCPMCHHVYHRWGHTTAFDLAQLRAELAPSFQHISCRRTAFVEFKGRSMPGKLKSLMRWFLAKWGAAIAVPSIFFVARKD
jgi:SAM-dependent methyltransferase